ncbi:uncharacterized protein LOC113774956 [Coffea eugenioides]|uniref:Uncharacterized protein n=1 Tax=Coffea arabica TaxID=13443 RepID=A0A6P6SMT1_COFAR|nr:uncharacterized protein LOC113692808 [Coffea arabica]XP_027175427.1 uncharacterized protein LOC113774956 [Coffea eugenioides]
MMSGGTLLVSRFTSFRTPLPRPNNGRFSMRICHKRGQVSAGDMSPRRTPSAFCIPSSLRVILVTAALAAAASAAVFSAVAVEAGADSETLSNVPQTLSGECSSVSGKDDCKKPRIQRPKSKKAETCTVKCVNTCIRGGLGSPGEGPLNIRRPLVVFKQGFRSRQYCLIECSDICNLIGDGDDGP